MRFGISAALMSLALFVSEAQAKDFKDFTDDEKGEITYIVSDLCQTLPYNDTDILEETKAHMRWIDDVAGENRLRAFVRTLALSTG